MSYMKFQLLQITTDLIYSRGAYFVSKLAVYYPSRFIAFGFLALSYGPPTPLFDYDDAMALSTKAFGYGTIGFYKFFSEEGSDKFLEAHVRISDISQISSARHSNTTNVAGVFALTYMSFGSKVLDD